MGQEIFGGNPTREFSDDSSTTYGAAPEHGAILAGNGEPLGQGALCDVCRAGCPGGGSLRSRGRTKHHTTIVHRPKHLTEVPPNQASSALCMGKLTPTSTRLCKLLEK